MNEENVEPDPFEDAAYFEADANDTVARFRRTVQIDLEGLFPGFSMGDTEATDILCEKKVAEIIRNKTERISFRGEDALLNLPQECWDRFTHITLDLLCDNVLDYLDKMLKCCHLHLKSNFIVNIENVIASMASFEYLCYDGSMELSEKMFTMMTEKSHLGTGLKHLEFKRKNAFIRPSVFCNFLAQVKLPPSGTVTVISGIALLGGKKEFMKYLADRGILVIRHDNGEHLMLRGGSYIKVYTS